MRITLAICILITSIGCFGQVLIPNCNVQYTDLDRQVFLYSDSAAIYRLNGELYTGCAFQEHIKDNSIYYYHISNGWIDQELGFDLGGQLNREFNFKDGKKHGLHIMLRENGSKYIEEFYENGECNGTSRRWYSNGQIARDALFEHGKLIFEHFYDENGDKIPAK